MDFIPFDIFKDLMLDLVGKYSGPPIAPTDVPDLQSTIPLSLSLGPLSKAGQADPQPQSDKTSSSDNKQHALDNFSSIKGSGTKGGDTTSGSPIERGKEAPKTSSSDNKQHALDNFSSIKGSGTKGGDPTSGSPIERGKEAPKSQSVQLNLDSIKNVTLPGHPDSRKSVIPANSNKLPFKSCSVSTSSDIQKDTSSDKYTAHGHSVSTIKTKGYAADSYSRLKDGDYKKDSSSSGYSDHRQTFCSTRSKSAAFSSRSETRDLRVSHSDEHASHSSEKSHGSAEIIKAEEKLNTEVAATPQTKDDSHFPRMKDKLNEQEPSETVDENTKNSVEKLARFVVEMGLGMDAFHADKLANNPHFSFLKAGRTTAYEFLKEKLFEFRKSFGSSAQIQQPDSKSKEPIPESPQAVQKSPDSASTTTDCFTAPMLPPLRKRKATPDAPAAPVKKMSQDETMKVDAKTRDAAEKLARFVVRMGPEKERFTKAEAANPQFWFLNQKDHPAYEFYQMKLAEFSKVKQAGELSSPKPTAPSKSSSKSQSPTDPTAEPRSALLLLSEIYDSDEEDSQSKDGVSENGTKRGRRQRKSRTKRISSNTKRASTKHDPRVGMRSKVSEWQKYLRSADELANQSVRVIILARKIGAVKKRLARDIAASKKKRTTIGTQTELEVPLAKKVLVKLKRSPPKQKPRAEVKKLINPPRVAPVKPESLLQQMFMEVLTVDARTKETAENLARFIVEVGSGIGGGFDLNVLSNNPEFWFLNDKCSSAYKFYEMKLSEFFNKRKPDPVKANNLGKAALQDIESQTPKHAEPTPLVSQDTDPDCFIVEPEEHAPQPPNPTPPAPQRSNPTSPAPQRSNPTSPAPQRSNPTSPAPQRSNPTPPAPQRPNPTPPAPQRPNPTPPAPQRPNPTPPAPQRPNPTPPAPQRPNPTPPAPQRPNPTPPAPQRSNPTSPAPQRSNPTPPAPQRPNPTPPAPQRSNPTPPAPQRPNPTPPAPQRPNPTPPAPQRPNPTPQRANPTPQRANSTPPAPQRANSTPPAPQRANPTPQRANPTPQRANPTQPAPQRANPTPPAPQRANPTPPAPQRANPTPPAPQRPNPTPQRPNPTPQRANPTPQRANPTPQRANPTPPAPQRANPTPQRPNPTPPAPQQPNPTPPAPHQSNPTPPAPPCSKPVEILPQAAEQIQPAQQPSEAVQEVPQSSEPPEPEPDYSIMVSCCSDDEDSDNP
ncbi:uncharacterized protein LOC144799486 [Lissotriton helveticus]